MTEYLKMNKTKKIIKNAQKQFIEHTTVQITYHVFIKLIAAIQI